MVDDAPISVFIDTTSLPRHLRRPGGAFEVLTQLAEIELLKVYISRVSKDEWTSQICEQASKQLDQCASAMASAVGGPAGVDSKLGSAFENVQSILKDEKTKLKERVATEAETILTSIKATIIDISESHGKSVVDSYFAGRPPFRSPKHRDDFPDAFIFEALQDLRRKSQGRLLIVTNDTWLAQACRTMDNVQVFEDVKRLIQSEHVVNRQRILKYQTVWNEGFVGFAAQAEKYEAQMVKALENQFVDALAWKKIRSSIIPDDNSEAVITMIDKPQKVTLEFDTAENLGAGWMSIPLCAELIVLADFHVYRSDAYHQPDWVSITYADPEEHHYFDAQASFLIEVTGSVSVSFDDSDLDTGGLSEPSNVELDDELTIEVLDHA